MKKLLGLALLVSVFAVAPAFAMEGGEEPKKEEKKSERCFHNFYFKNYRNCPIYKELSGVFTPVESVKGYGHYLHNLATFAFHAPIKTGITLLLVKAFFDNRDAIKAQLGLDQDDNQAAVVDGDQSFAAISRSGCGCENEQEEEQKEEAACELKKKRN